MATTVLSRHDVNEMELEKLLARIEKEYEFVKVKENEDLTLITAHGTELKILLRVDEIFRKDAVNEYPIQVVIILGFDGRALFRHGCETNRENGIVLKWFNRLENKIREKHSKALDKLAHETETKLRSE